MQMNSQTTGTVFLSATDAISDNFFKTHCCIPQQTALHKKQSTQLWEIDPKLNPGNAYGECIQVIFITAISQKKSTTMNTAIPQQSNVIDWHATRFLLLQILEVQIVKQCWPSTSNGLQYTVKSGQKPSGLAGKNAREITLYFCYVICSMISSAYR